MRDRNQHVQRALPRGSQRRVGDRRVLHVERRLLGEHLPVLDVAQVALVVRAHVDRVVRQLLGLSVQPEVEHERRARVALLVDLAVGPATAQSVGYQAVHRAAEVRVHDDRVRVIRARVGPHPDGTPPFEQHLLDRLAQPNVDAQSARDAGHGLRDRGATADRVVHAILVLEECEDGEQTRAPKWRHPEVLRLEREAEANPRVGEEAAQVAVDRAPRPHLGQQLHQRKLGQITPALHRRRQDRLEGLELASIVGQVALEVVGVARAEPCDLLLHPLDVGRGVHLPPRAEDEPILRVESNHLDFPTQIVPRDCEDLFEDPRVEEERGPDVEAEPIRLHGTRSATDAVGAFDDADLRTGAGEKQSGGQTTRAGSDDDDALAHRWRASTGSSSMPWGSRAIPGRMLGLYELLSAPQRCIRTPRAFEPPRMICRALSATRSGFSMVACAWIAMACQQPVQPPSWKSSEPAERLTQARELHFRGVDGDEAAAEQARQMLEELRASSPDAPLLTAYLGSARLLQARDAWAPWDKGKYGAEGIRLLDEAVDSAPEDVEIRFLRGVSTINLPDGFGRTETAKEDLAWAADKAEAAWRAGQIDDRIKSAALARRPAPETQ